MLYLRVEQLFGALNLPARRVSIRRRSLLRSGSEIASSLRKQISATRVLFRAPVFLTALHLPGKAVFKQSAFEGDVWFVGENIEARIFSGCEVVFEEVTYNSPSTIRFRYADLGRCRFLGTDLRRVDFMGVRWCERVGSSEWFNRQGLFEEIATEDRRGNPWADDRGAKKKFAGRGNKEAELRPWPEIERLYRELKVNYENRGDYPRAGDFHIGEKEARRQYESRCGMKVLLFLYRALSKYGERATPAALWLTGVVLVSLLSYVFLGATPQGSTDLLAFSSPGRLGRSSSD